MKARIATAIPSPEDAELLLNDLNRKYKEELSVAIDRIKGVPAPLLMGQTNKDMILMQLDMIDITPVKLVEWHPQFIIVDIHDNLLNTKAMGLINVSHEKILNDFAKEFHAVDWNWIEDAPEDKRLEIKPKDESPKK